MALTHLPYDEWFLPFNPPRAVHPHLSIDDEAPWEADRALYPVADEDEDENGGDA